MLFQKEVCNSPAKCKYCTLREIDKNIECWINWGDIICLSLLLLRWIELILSPSALAMDRIPAPFQQSSHWMELNQSEMRMNTSIHQSVFTVPVCLHVPAFIFVALSLGSFQATHATPWHSSWRSAGNSECTRTIFALYMTMHSGSGFLQMVKGSLRCLYILTSMWLILYSKIITMNSCTTPWTLRRLSTQI